MKTWTRTLTRMLALLAALYVSAAPVQAKAQNVSQVVNIYDAVVSYPLASWQRGARIFEQSEMNRVQNGPQFLLEFIPKGQSFSNWSTLYAVHGFTANSVKSMPISQYIKMSLSPFTRACGKKNITVQDLQSTKSSKMIIVYCTDSPNAPRGSGYAAGVGEVGLMAFYKHKNTFIKVYQEWRGKAFKLKDRRTWPVAEAELRKMIARFQTIKISPSPRPSSGAR